MTHVVQVVPHVRMGGMQRMAMLLDEHLPSAGVSSTLVDLQSMRERQSPASLWRQLARRWRTERPEAVMAHTVLAAALALTAARAAGVDRRVLVIHASQPSLGAPKSIVVALLGVTRVATDVVVCGHAALATFQPWLRVVARAKAIPNAIPVPQTHADEPEPTFDSIDGMRSSRPVRVLVAGRLVPQKRVDVAIRAVAGSTASLTVCGDGPLLEELRTLAETTGADVTFAGRVPSEEMAGQYRNHEVLAFPSEREGLPLVMLEAASHGLAVIASDRPFNREVLGDAAWYCDGDDPMVWRAGLDALAADDSVRRDLAASARERIDLFDLSTMVRRYAELIVGRG
ncbi:glycosyltransferase family 4 protein [Pedococcus soli]